MNLTELASSMMHGESRKVFSVGEVKKIDTYKSDLSDQLVIGATFPRVSKLKMQLSHDLTLHLENEGTIKMKLSPLLTLIQRGIIIENTRLAVTRIIKICNSVHFYFLIESLHVFDSWTSVFNKDLTLNINGYKPKYLPLGGKLGTNLFDRISNIDIINIPDQVIQEIELDRSGIFDTTTLKGLDKNWNKITVKKALLVRILSISKIKFIVPKNLATSISLRNI